VQGSARVCVAAGGTVDVHNVDVAMCWVSAPAGGTVVAYCPKSAVREESRARSASDTKSLQEHLHIATRSGRRQILKGKDISEQTKRSSRVEGSGGPMAGFLSLGGMGPQSDPRGQQGIGDKGAGQISASKY
jgi:hypothetical protein